MFFKLKNVKIWSNNFAYDIVNQTKYANDESPYSTNNNMINY